ncbi:DUF5955 family protein [Actinacidiphila reveromycinica]|uniref:DUF5955 family protein n=1 Tax=Actinacidiphila reveromycinica TaxID=659352 RepID=UPI001F27AC2B|nr:DUF5955 family protein [Streptomyces sp. SN-593]
MLDDGRGGTVGGGPGTGLADAVDRMRRELAAYRRALPDRSVAEDGLGALARAAAADRAPDPADSERMRHSLLLVVAAVGSVSALTAPLDALREAVETLAPPCP